MPAAKTPTGNARHWVAWQTKVLTDADLMSCSNAARMVFPYLLALSAHHGLSGRIPVEARKLQVTMRCDGGVAEMASALAELVDVGLLVEDPGGDERFLYFRGWTKNRSVDRQGSETRSTTSTTSQNKRRHNEGYHLETAKDDCEGCRMGLKPENSLPQFAELMAKKWPEETKPAPKPRAKRTVRAAPKQVDLDAAPGSTTEVEAQFKASFDEVFSVIASQNGSRMDGYRFLLTQADTIAEVHKGLSANVAGELRNAVLFSAVEYHLPKTFQGSQWSALARGAKALNENDGHYFAILSAQAAASQHFEDSNHALKWVVKVAGNKRSDWLEGKSV